MELAREPGVRLVTDALVRAVVHIDKQLAPFAAQCRGIDSIAVILRRDIAAVCSHLAYRLVMRAVPILQLIDRRTTGLCQQLVTHADTTDGLATHGHLLLQNLDSIHTLVGVARTVSQEETVEGHLRIVIVPRYANHLNATVDETAYDVGLHTAIDEHHLLAGTLVVADDILAADTLHPVDGTVVLGFNCCSITVEDQLAHHHAMLTKHLRQLTGVNARHTGHLLTLQPVGQALLGVPVRVLLAVVGHNDSRSVDSVTLHKRRQAILLEREWRHTIVTHKRKG